MSLPSFPVGSRRSDMARADVTPFGALQREIDRLFSDFSRGFPALGGGELTPRMDITEKDGTLILTAELPGLEERDVEITLVDQVLTIRGEKKAEREEKGENRYLMERSYGAFARSIELPEGIGPEQVKASMAKGVLTVTVPKPPRLHAEPKKIAIQAGV